MKKPIESSITVIVPAYNEERDLRATVEGANEILIELFKDYEILIFDDCSTDRTGEIADALAKNNKKINVFHNKTNMGFGYNNRKGMEIAKKGYFIGIPGDNEVEPSSIRSILEHVGESDIIIPFIANKKVRPLLRRIIAISYISILNLLFGLNLKQYTGLMVYKTALLKQIKVRTNSFAYQAEILLPLVKRGYSYKEVPMIIKNTDKTTLLRLKNIIGVLITILRLFFEINFSLNKSKVNKKTFG